MSDAETTAKRFDPANPNLSIWGRNERTDVYVGQGSDNKVLKEFSRGGGFKGKSPNATYIVKRLTAEFGPVGQGWGCDIVNEQFQQGAPVFQDGVVLYHETVHMLRVEFWYKKDGEVHRFQQFGQTTFVGKTQKGAFTDEEAPKKSLTDAMTKAAAWLGFASDVHMGMWDDNKYVTDSKREAEAEREVEARAAALKRPYAFVNARGDIHHEGSAAAWHKGWENRINAMVAAEKLHVLRDAWALNGDAIISTRLVDPDLVDSIERMVQEALAESTPPAAEAAKEAPTTEAPAPEEKPPAPQPAAKATEPDYPAEPPKEFAFEGLDGTVHAIGASKKGAPAHHVWIASWKLSAKNAGSVGKLMEWRRKNEKNLAMIGHYYPEVATMAVEVYDAMIAAPEKARELAGAK